MRTYLVSAVLISVTALLLNKLTHFMRVEQKGTVLLISLDFFWAGMTAALGITKKKYKPEKKSRRA